MLRQGAVETAEQSLAGIAGVAANEEGGAGVVVDDREIVALSEADDDGELAREALPGVDEGQYGGHADLQMGMVGGRGTAVGTVIEHDQLGVGREQAVDFAIHVADGLRLVAQCGQREVHGQDRVGIDEQFPLAVDCALHLIGRTVGRTEEAGTLLEAAGVDFGGGGHDASGIPLHDEADVAVGEFACLHVGKLAIAAPGVRPCVELAVEEALERRLGHGGIKVAGDHAAPGFYLECAQPVLI